MECAEHIEEEADIVKQLCNLGNVILFSAAIPNQGGAYHINEQYQEYWIGQFAKEGYLPIDCIRKRIWNNPDVRYFYKQNIFLFVKKTIIKDTSIYRKLYEQNKENIVNLVHPELYSLPLHRDQSWHHIF